VIQPLADRIGHGASERGIREQQPPPRSHAVGLVVEPLGEDLGEILDRGTAQQVRVDCGNAVRAVRAHDGEVGHPDVPGRAFLDEAHVPNPFLVAREAGLDVIEQSTVDLEHDLEVPRQNLLEPRVRPFLERLGQKRVVRVRRASAA
jgi:hypothetical protein